MIEVGSVSRFAMSFTAYVDSCAATLRTVIWSAPSRVTKPMLIVPSLSVKTFVAKPCAMVLFGSRMFSARSGRL